MSKKDINISNAFYMEPEEIVKYFENKGCKISFDWHEVYAQAHAKAFTVAKMTNADLLKDTQNMLTKAIKEGWSSQKFKKNASELFLKNGWTGFKKMKNPRTGEVKKVELGTPRRIKKIFSCNMNSAYAVGRYKEQMEDVDFAPYFQYQCILDGRTRPEHKALHGKVFRYDDPFWQTMYPPNGWNCRCFVISLSDRDLTRKGLKLESSEGKLKEISTIVGGEEKTITAYDFKANGKNYRLKPDAGWDTNLGNEAWNMDVLAYSKIQNLPQPIKDKFISDMAQNVHTQNNFNEFVTKIVNNKLINKSPIKEVPITWLSPKILKTLSHDNLSPKTPVVVFQDERIGHILDRKVGIIELSRLYEIINNPDETYYDYTRQGNIGLAFIRFIDNETVLKVCIKLDKKKRKQIVNYISTVGKVPKSELLNHKMYKKIE